MSDDEEEYELDLEHPWVEASTIMNPQPIPTVMKLDDAEFESNGKMVRAALVTIISPVGVFTFFLPPGSLAHIVNQGIGLLQVWEQEKKPGIVIADKGMMKQAGSLFEAAERMKKNGT